MVHFPHINNVMYRLFGTSPPTRACVAVDVPPPIRVRLDAVGCSELHPGDRKALHVQSMSYWAPANIGPYSQCVAVRQYLVALSPHFVYLSRLLKIDQRMFISGQIGLIPGSMTMPSPRSLPLEVALSLQHARRISLCMSGMLAYGVAGEEIVQSAVLWLAKSSPRDVQAVAEAWNKQSSVCKTQSLVYIL